MKLFLMLLFCVSNAICLICDCKSPLRRSPSENQNIGREFQNIFNKGRGSSVKGGYGISGGYGGYGGNAIYGAYGFDDHEDGAELDSPKSLFVTRQPTSSLPQHPSLIAHHLTNLAPHTSRIPAAIHTLRNVQVIDVPTTEDIITPTNLIIEPNVAPINIEYRSQSSPVNVNQVHIPGRPGIVRHTNSEDEPDRLIHEVVKPVIQEVHETIVPYRSITQQVLPVQEEVNSLVARGHRQQVLAAQPAAAAPVLSGTPGLSYFSQFTKGNIVGQEPAITGPVSTGIARFSG